MYNSKNTVLDLATSTKRAFVFRCYSDYKACEYLAVVIISQKTGRQLASYDIDLAQLEDIQRIETLGALVNFAQANTQEVA